MHDDQRAAVALRWLPSLRNGVYLFDAQWHWIAGNALAEAFVARGWWKGQLHARLDAGHPQTQNAWDNARHHGADASPEKVLPVRDPNGELVAFAALRQAEERVGDPTSRTHSLLVRPLAWADTDALTLQLRRLYALTDAEARLLLALRRDGDPPHAAEMLGITEGSLRTRLHVIYEKTGTHRLGALLILLDALANVIAQ
ncbi:MAG: hypothetical protein JSR26_01760 [Proteobacteria bacterium]|nr:hypothetical protein [Pseudomonadota bacterium]